MKPDDAVSNIFRQHIPNFVDVDPPDPIPFTTTEELLGLEVVQRYIGEKHSHFAISENMLMEVSNGGKNWWVVGYIAKPDLVNLPKWVAHRK